MRHVGTTGWARNYVVLPNRVAFVAKAQLPFAVQNEEHLFFATMGMEGALGFAGRKNCQVVAQVLGSDVIAYLAAARGVEAVFFDIVKLDLVKVHHGPDHTFLHWPDCGMGGEARPTPENEERTELREDTA